MFNIRTYINYVTNAHRIVATSNDFILAQPAKNYYAAGCVCSLLTLLGHIGSVGISYVIKEVKPGINTLSK